MVQVATSFDIRRLPGAAGQKSALLVNPPVYDSQYWAQWAQPYGLLRIGALQFKFHCGASNQKGKHAYKRSARNASDHPVGSSVRSTARRFSSTLASFVTPNASAQRRAETTLAKHGGAAPRVRCSRRLACFSPIALAHTFSSFFS